MLWTLVLVLAALWLLGVTTVAPAPAPQIAVPAIAPATEK